MIMNKKTVDPKDDLPKGGCSWKRAMVSPLNALKVHYCGATARVLRPLKVQRLVALRLDAYIMVNHKPVLNPVRGGSVGH
jgi:hypothetical protein